MGDPGSGTLTKLVKTVGEAGAGLGQGILSLIPVIGDGLGTLFSGALGALTGIATEAIGFAQGLVDVNKDINNAGLGMVRGLEDMSSAANSAGMPFQQFTKALLENVDSVRLMTGGVQGGVGLISKSLKRLDRDGMQMLYSMGFTVEDIIGTMTDLAATASLTGKTLSDAELADATDKYLRNQQELARITGISIKEQKAQLEISRRSVFVQAQLQGLTNEQRIATQGFLNVLKDPGLQEFALRGFTTDQNVMALMQQLPTFGAAIQEVTQGVKLGALTQEQAVARLRELSSDPRIAAELAEAQRTFGVTIEGGMGRVSGIVGLLGELQTQIMQQYTQSGADESIDYQARTLEGMNKSVAAMEQLMLDVNAGFSTLGFTLFSFVDGYLGKAGDAAGSVVDRFQEMSNSLKEYNLIRERRIEAEKNGDTELLRELTVKEREAKDKLTKLTGDMLGDTGNLLQSFTKQALEILDQLKTTISDSIVEGFNKVLNNVADASVNALPGVAATGILPDNIQIRMAKETEDALTKMGVNAAEVLHPDNRANLTLEQIELVSKLRDILVGMSEEQLKTSGWQQKDQSFAQWFAGFKDFEKAPPQALGGIFDYKPGGEIVRVAESSAEIIAPAKRGADGKLGLEVSGAMFDNSRLLQNLVKVNEAQASMMAGLTSQMTNMNTNFEKLVYEQRQANRLAV
jgi:hypothetical protein